MAAKTEREIDCFDCGWLGDWKDIQSVKTYVKGSSSGRSSGSWSDLRVNR